ncbi:MAG: hypothetical protein FVQ83_13120 [Chloroflexi bacterium]|nr:hypothetical protein [Chloroflexota bacterium]
MSEQNNGEHNVPTHHVYDWIWQMGKAEGVVPPFCVEVTLNDGNSYYLHSVPDRDEKTLSLVLRIWDFRTITPETMEEIKQNLNKLRSRGELQDNLDKIHPSLDWADIRLNLQNINYVIEWNDRLWPREERPQFGLLKE